MQYKEKLSKEQQYAIYVAIFVFMMFCHTMYNYNQRLQLQHQDDYVTVKATRVTQLQYVDENGNKFEESTSFRLITFHIIRMTLPITLKHYME